MNKKQKLELTWIGKEHRPKLEPRILLGDPDKSYHAKHRVTDHDLFDNRLIFGDNLLPQIIGPLLACGYFWKKYGKQEWRRYAMVLSVGFGVGMSLVGMFCAALAMVPGRSRRWRIELLLSGYIRRVIV